MVLNGRPQRARHFDLSGVSRQLTHFPAASLGLHCDGTAAFDFGSEREGTGQGIPIRFG